MRILSTIDRELLKPNASVALHKHSNALVDVLPPEADSSIMMLTSGEGPRITLRVLSVSPYLYHHGGDINPLRCPSGPIELFILGLLMQDY